MDAHFWQHIPPQLSVARRACFGLARRSNGRVASSALIAWFALCVPRLSFAERPTFAAPVATATVASGGLDLRTNFVFDALDRQRDAPPSERVPVQTDGVYGRFDGQLSIAPFVGVAYTRAGMLTELGLSSYYFHTIGVQAKYADGRLFPGSPTTPFSVSTIALAVRPLFLLRFSRDLEQGPGLLDLTIDSLTLKVGGFWSQQIDTEVEHRGLETELSVGVPLFSKSDGPWITLALANRYPQVTHAGHAVDLAASGRFEWSFSLGQ